MRYKKCFFFMMLVTGLYSGCLHAQQEDMPVQGFTLFSFDNTLPESLLSATTAVFVKSPAQWKTLAGKAHVRFRGLGIDAVAYYNAATIYAGKQVTTAFAGDVKARGIQNIILLEQEDSQFTLIITTLSQEAPFFTQGQKAYRIQGNDLETVLATLTRAVSTSGITLTNHLILEKPEFFYKTSTFMGKRFESFNSDLKIDELAVPVFEEVSIPPDDPGGEENQAVLQIMQSYNAEVAAFNKELENIFRDVYPFKSKPVRYSEGEKALRQSAFQFVLLRMHAPKESIRRLLGYDLKESTGKEKPSSQPVYKYYVKHLASGEVYLGTTWDAAPTWEEALENYINNMKSTLKIR